MKNMNRFSIYALLVLVYLGMSKSFAPAEKITPYIKNQYDLSKYIKNAPVSAILIDYFKAGFIIKTYFHRYKIVHGFTQPETITMRISKNYYQDNILNLGMSLFNRKERLNEETFIPSPPGMLYVDDSFYGKWTYENSGNQIWDFHRGYKHFPELFGWGTFRPTKEFLTQLKINLASEKPVYGTNEEFGLNGTISKEFYKHNQRKIQNIEKIKYHLKNFLSIPWQKKYRPKVPHGNTVNKI